MGKRTLKGYLARFICAEFLFTLGLLVLSFLWTVAAVDIGFAVPANYAEKQLPEMAEKIANGNVDLTDFPNFYEVRIEDKAGKVIASAMSDTSQEALEKARTEGSYSRNRRNVVYYEGEKQNVFLSYALVADFSSPVLRRMLPNEEFLAALVFLLLWVIGFLLVIRYFAGKIQKELVKLMEMNEEIRRMNLDFTPPESSIREFQALIASVSLMKEELSASLKAQWAVKRQQEKALQAITHDIRTPITLISGNLELLDETSLTEEQLDLVSGLGKGVSRLDHYVGELKKVSGLATAQEKKTAITKQYISELISLAEEIASARHQQVKVLSEDTSDIVIQQSKVMEAFQNAVLNAAEFSPENTVLKLAFTASPSDYKMTVTDAGSGFDQKNLEKASERFYTSRVSRGEGHFGLGLSIAEDVMKQNNGRLELGNEMEKGQVVGGKVSLVFQKL